MRFYYSDLFKEKVKLLNPNVKEALKGKLELMVQKPQTPFTQNQEN